MRNAAVRSMGEPSRIHFRPAPGRFEIGSSIEEGKTIARTRSGTFAFFSASTKRSSGTNDMFCTLVTPKRTAASE